MSSDYILGLQIMCRFFIALGFSYIGLEAAGSRNLVLYYRTKISLIVVFSLSGLFFTYIAADIAYTIGHPRALLIAIFVRRMCMFVSGDSFLSLIGKGITGTVLYGMIMLAIHIKNPVVRRQFFQGFTIMDTESTSRALPTKKIAPRERLKLYGS